MPLTRAERPKSLIPPVDVQMNGTLPVGSLLLLTRQPEPPTLVLEEPSCYHFRVLDPRVAATLSATPRNLRFTKGMSRGRSR